MNDGSLLFLMNLFIIKYVKNQLFAVKQSITKNKRNNIILVVHLSCYSPLQNECLYARNDNNR